MDVLFIRNLLALTIVGAELIYAYQNRNKGFMGVISSQFSFVVGLVLAGLIVTPLVLNWAPERARAVVNQGTEMEGLVADTLGGVSQGFAAVLDSQAAPVAPPADGSAAAPAAVPQPPAPAAPPAAAPVAPPVTQLEIWKFPQRSGLKLLGPSLTLYFADGSGISREVSSEEIGEAGASACGWLLVGGLPTRLVACDTTPVEVFDVGSVTGVEELPVPPAPTPAPQPTAAPPAPTPAPSIERLAAACRQKWQAYRTSMSWFNEASPLENFPDQSAWQLTLTKDWFRSFYSVSSSDLQIQSLEIPWGLGRALDGLTNSEGFFIGTGTMCLDQ